MFYIHYTANANMWHLEHGRERGRQHVGGLVQKVLSCLYKHVGAIRGHTCSSKPLYIAFLHQQHRRGLKCQTAPCDFSLMYQKNIIAILFRENRTCQIYTGEDLVSQCRKHLLAGRMDFFSTRKGVWEPRWNQMAWTCVNNSYGYWVVKLP